MSFHKRESVYKITLTYNYTWDTIVYENNKYSPSVTYYSTESSTEQEKYEANHPIGSAIRIYLNPQYPSQSYLTYNVNAVPGILIGLAIMAIPIVVGIKIFD